MKLDLIHTVNQCLDFTCDGVRLFRYTYRPNVTQTESPKPFFHPLCTLRGNTVTICRPHDHRWHTGLAMTLAHVSGHNFWGGPSYVKDKGYVHLNNNGTQRHDTWAKLDLGDDQLTLQQQLTWLTVDANELFKETRTIRAGQINPQESRWTLEFASNLTNVSGEALHLGSPTTEGRPNAGYGGLFWRGPRSFRNGSVLDANGINDADQLRGQRSPWLAYIGKHDQIDEQSTLVFVDYPSNPRYPTQWFVRSEPYGCVSFAFMFDEEYEIKPDAVLSLNYRIFLADGALSESRIQSLCK